jgi:hypothetical protein
MQNKMIISIITLIVGGILYCIHLSNFNIRYTPNTLRSICKTSPVYIEPRELKTKTSVDNKFIYIFLPELTFNVLQQKENWTYSAQAYQDFEEQIVFPKPIYTGRYDKKTNQNTITIRVDVYPDPCREMHQWFSVLSNDSSGKPVAINSTILFFDIQSPRFGIVKAYIGRVENYIILVRVTSLKSIQVVDTQEIEDIIKSIKYSKETSIE